MFFHPIPQKHLIKLPLRFFSSSYMQTPPRPLQFVRSQHCTTLYGSVCMYVSATHTLNRLSTLSFSPVQCCHHRENNLQKVCSLAVVIPLVTCNTVLCDCPPARTTLNKRGRMWKRPHRHACLSIPSLDKGGRYRISVEPFEPHVSLVYKKNLFYLLSYAPYAITHTTLCHCNNPPPPLSHCKHSSL